MVENYWVISLYFNKMAHRLTKIKIHKTDAMKIFGTLDQNHDGLRIRWILVRSITLYGMNYVLK